jgi:alkylated DNA repair dioxygenase AlkB
MALDDDAPGTTAEQAAAAAAPRPTAAAKPQPLIRRLEKRFQRHLTNHRRRPRELPADLQTGVVDWKLLLDVEDDEAAAADPTTKKRPCGGAVGGDRAATAASLVALPTSAALARRPDLEQARQGLWCDDGRQPCSSPTTSTTTTVDAYAVRGHPGLVVFPAAVPFATQLSLASRALARWPEPPLGRTNLHALYPGGLHGILKAAAADVEEEDAGEEEEEEEATTAALRRVAAALDAGRRAKAQAQQEADGRSRPVGFKGLRCARRPRRDRPNHPRADEDDEEEGGGAYGGNGSGNGNNDNNNGGRDQQQQPAPHSPRPDHGKSSNPCTVCWERAEAAAAAAAVSAGEGEDAQTAAPPSAAAAAAAVATERAPAMLRALRWVTLGPPYNWTTRLYEPETPHLPLPPELVRMARFFAALAGEALSVAAAAEEGEGAGSAAAAAALAASSSAATFQPDAALVNYYREGDTLFAHVDESEAGFDGKRGGTTEEEAARLPAPPPLVTLSVGAAALFLVGGPRRESEPVTPLLLRSGDVVVLAGPARRAHHGVPRVFGGERALVPRGLVEAAAARAARAAVAGGGGEGEEGARAAARAAAAAVFSAVRINISVRQAIDTSNGGGGGGVEGGAAGS